MLLKAIAPYTRVRLPYLATELNGIPISDVEDLLVSLILDGKVDGKIDQVRPGVASSVGQRRSPCGAVAEAPAPASVSLLHKNQRVNLEIARLQGGATGRSKQPKQANGPCGCCR